MRIPPPMQAVVCVGRFVAHGETPAGGRDAILRHLSYGLLHFPAVLGTGQHATPPAEILAGAGKQWAMNAPNVE